MRPLSFTVSADGSSDSVLVPILRWAVTRYHPLVSPSINFVDYNVSGRPKGGLAQRLAEAMRLYPGDILVVHRDAEAQSPLQRETEIRNALAGLVGPKPSVFLIPVRMTEAWLLLDESAIRRAADNPAGRNQLDLPPVARLERLPDPKQMLHDALRTASGYSGRRLRNVRPEQQVRRVAELVGSFELIENLDAFLRFRRSLGDAIRMSGE